MVAGAGAGLLVGAVLTATGQADLRLLAVALPLGAGLGAIHATIRNHLPCAGLCRGAATGMAAFLTWCLAVAVAASPARPLDAVIVASALVGHGVLVEAVLARGPQEQTVQGAHRLPPA